MGTAGSTGTGQCRDLCTTDDDCGVGTGGTCVAGFCHSPRTSVRPLPTARRITPAAFPTGGMITATSSASTIPTRPALDDGHGACRLRVRDRRGLSRRRRLRRRSAVPRLERMPDRRGSAIAACHASRTPSSAVSAARRGSCLFRARARARRSELARRNGERISFIVRDRHRHRGGESNVPTRSGDRKSGLGLGLRLRRAIRGTSGYALVIAIQYDISSANTICMRTGKTSPSERTRWVSSEPDWASCVAGPERRRPRS